jgi:type I restriction enzyme S subunit
MMWRLVKLGDLCRQDRQSVKTGERGDLPYIGLECIEAGTGQLLGGGMSKTPESPQANSFSFDSRHVLYGKLRPYLNKVALPTANGKCSTEIIPLLPGEDIDRSFLAYYLRSSATVASISEKTSGSRMPRADMDVVLSLEVPLPALPEQRRIVDLLTRAEGIVRLRREAAAKAAELIPAIFIDMFGDPAMNPKGWPVVALGDLLAEPPTLGTMKKPTLEPQPWLDLRVANIQGGQLRLEDKKWLDLTPDEVARFELRTDDIILARAIGSLDHLGKAVVVNPDGPWTFDSHLMRVRVNQSRLLPKVLTTFLETASGRREFLSRTRRSAVQFNINGKELRLLRLPLPPIDLQAVFVRRFEEVSSIARQQTDGLTKAQATFNALLAQAFSPATSATSTQA